MQLAKGVCQQLLFLVANIGPPVDDRRQCKFPSVPKMVGGQKVEQNDVETEECHDHLGYPRRPFRSQIAGHSYCYSWTSSSPDSRRRNRHWAMTVTSITSIRNSKRSAKIFPQFRVLISLGFDCHGVPENRLGRPAARPLTGLCSTSSQSQWEVPDELPPHSAVLPQELRRLLLWSSIS